jgi:YidC/Oxa1 family membrane protein insertase
VKEDQKNFLLFAVVAAALLFAWPMAVSWLFPEQRPAPTRLEDGKVKPVDNPIAAPAADSPQPNRTREVVLRETPRVAIETPKLQGSINLKGARIDDLVLKTHKQTIDKDSPPIRLFSPAGAAQAYFADFGWSGSGGALPDANTVFTPSGGILAPGRPVTLSWTNSTGQRFDIRIAVDEQYMFTAEHSIANTGQSPVMVRPHARLVRFGVPADPDTWTDHVGPIGAFGNGANYDVGYPNLKGQGPGFFEFGSTAKPGENSFSARGGWIGFGDKYWLAALIPNQSAQVNSAFRATTTDRFQADFALPEIVVQPNKRVTVTSHLFAGAKEVNVLDAYQSQLGVPYFGKAIDWGWFEIVEKPIFYYLDWLWKLVGNFGVAIILLTITIRGLLFPIAQKQFASMANMRAIQPKMKALQERYKDNKQLQQQEIMKLYKEEKVNPLAGCLPILLQIPIMFALYKVLLLTIEMRHQPFVLWIKDLSAPDPLTPLNLFGLLAFTPPSFIAIGVFPILLGVSMYFQIKLNPAPMDEMQKQVFAIMPWMLMFVMAPFAVGLQLYWITSNVITIAQQSWLYSRHPALKEPIKKEAPK